MKRIIIIDDDKVFLDEISEVLRMSGYDVLAMTDIEFTLKKVEEVMPDMILLDLKMNRVSGFKIATRLRAIPRIENVKIVAMTGFYTEKEHRLLMNACGIDSCIIKPLKPLDIITQIEGIA
ncbi:MAG: response regulator [Candidatus Omnitrophota bacterium]